MKCKNYLKEKTQHGPKVSRTLLLSVRHLGMPLGSRGAAEVQVLPPHPSPPSARKAKAGVGCSPTGGLVTEMSDGMSDGMSFPPHISDQTKPPHPDRLSVSSD